MLPRLLRNKLNKESELIEEKQMAILKDSGERTAYETGAVRDCKEGKGRCDLMPLDILAELVDGDDVLENLSKFKEYGTNDCLLVAMSEFSNILAGGDYDDRNIWQTLLNVSKHFEDGANKYGPNNWQKGIPIHSYIDSAIRHYMKYRAGWDDEPHDRAFIWNLLCCAWTMKHHPEMDDFTEANKKHDGNRSVSCRDNTQAC